MERFTSLRNKTIMNIFAKLLGSEKVIESASKGIDKAFFTKEERSESWLQTLAAYEPFKLAQRLLALMFGGVFLGVFIVGTGLIMASIWVEPAKGLGQEIIKLNIDTLGFSISLMIGFYFAGGATEGIIGKLR